MLHGRRLGLRCALLGLSFAIVPLAACSSSVDETGAPEPEMDGVVGTTEEALCGTATASWADFPEGNGSQQCVTGVRAFYQNKFGAYVPPASGGPIGGCARYGACNIWSNPLNRPSSAKWNRYVWGTEKVQKYDMVVFPPVPGNPYGHIASVDHESGGKLYVMDSNWSPWHGRKAACVHDVGSYKPSGFYRLKSQEAPPSCDRSAGGFTFSCDGTQKAMSCVNVNEPLDPGSWADDYFCSTLDLGMKWSASGQIANMNCTHVEDSASTHAAAWADDYLCLPHQSPFAFTFSDQGTIDGKTCVHWNETHAPGWTNNYVCVDPVYDFSAAGFTFSGNGPEKTKTCVSVNEPLDPAGWSDNNFCSDTDIGMKWSSSGPIAGMDCTNITEPTEKLAKAWADNFLCLPKNADYKFTWSSKGQIAGKSCVRWYDHAETSPGRLDHWLCIDSLKTASPAGAPAPGAGGTTTSSAPGASGDGAGDADAAPSDSSGGCSVVWASTLAGANGENGKTTSWFVIAFASAAAVGLRRRAARSRSRSASRSAR